MMKIWECKDLRQQIKFDDKSQHGLGNSRSSKFWPSIGCFLGPTEFTLPLFYLDGIFSQLWKCNNQKSCKYCFHIVHLPFSQPMYHHLLLFDCDLYSLVLDFHLIKQKQLHLFITYH